MFFDGDSAKIRSNNLDPSLKIMAKKKKVKSVFSPIIILCLVIIGLLFIILLLAISQNSQVSDNLGTAIYNACNPRTETKSVISTEPESIPLTTVAPENYNALKTQAEKGLKAQFCHNQVRLPGNELPCTDKKCKPATSSPFPDCTASIIKPGVQSDPPVYKDGMVTITFTARLKANLSRRCIPKETETPKPTLACTNSGPATNCTPPAKGVWTVANEADGQYTKGSYETITPAGIVQKAKVDAETKAKAGLEKICAGMTGKGKPDPIVNDCQNGQQKGFCALGCAQKSGGSVYKPPAKPLSPCTGGLVEADSTHAKYKAVCKAECTYELACAPTDTPLPSPVKSGTPTSTPLR
jgi:hypothetical protein